MPAYCGSPGPTAGPISGGRRPSLLGWLPIPLRWAPLDPFLPTTQLQMLLAVVVGAFLISAIIGISVRDLPLRRAAAIAATTFMVCCAAGFLFVWNR